MTSKYHDVASGKASGQHPKRTRIDVYLMKRVSLCLLFAAAIQSLCYGDVTKLAAKDRGMPQDASRFHEVHSTSDLPPAVLALCDGGGDGKLAEPGQKYERDRCDYRPDSPGQTADLGSSQRRLLHGALRARRNRAHISHFGGKARRERYET